MREDVTGSFCDMSNRIGPMAHGNQPGLAGLDASGIPHINDVAPPLILSRYPDLSERGSTRTSPRAPVRKKSKSATAKSSQAKSRRFHSASRYTKARSTEHASQRESQRKQVEKFPADGYLDKLNKKYRYGKEAEASFNVEIGEPAVTRQTVVQVPTKTPSTEMGAKRVKSESKDASTSYTPRHSSKQTQSDWSVYLVNAQTQSEKVKRKHAKLQVKVSTQEEFEQSMFSKHSSVDGLYTDEGSEVYEVTPTCERSGEMCDSYTENDSSLEVNASDRDENDDLSDGEKVNQEALTLVSQKHMSTQCPGEKCMVMYVVTKNYKEVSEQWTQCSESVTEPPKPVMYASVETSAPVPSVPPDSGVDTGPPDADSFNRSSSAEGVDDDNISSVNSTQEFGIPLLPGIPVQPTIVPKAKDFLQMSYFSPPLDFDDKVTAEEVKPLQCYCKEKMAQQVAYFEGIGALQKRPVINVCNVCRMEDVLKNYMGDDRKNMAEPSVVQPVDYREKELITGVIEGTVCDDWKKVERSLKRLTDFGMNWDDKKLRGKNAENILQMAILNESCAVAINLTEFSDEETLRRVMYEGIAKQSDVPPNSLYMAIHMGAVDIASKILQKLELSDRVQILGRRMPPMTFTTAQSTNAGEESTSTYCLFKSAEDGLVDMFTLLVDQGAPLDLEDGNERTILHKLVSLTSTTRSEDWNSMLVTMFKHVLESAGNWWRTDPRMATFANHSNDLVSKRDALEFLLSKTNADGHDVLSYVVRRGTPEMLEAVISTPVYCSHEIPTITGAFGYTAYQTDRVDTVLTRDGSAILDEIVKRSPSTASRMLEIEPFNSMIRDKWHHFHLFHLLWFFGYIIYMGILSTVALTRPTNATSLQDMYQSPGDYLRLLGEVLVTLSIPIFFLGELIDMKNNRWTLPNPRQGDGLYRIIMLAFSLCLIFWIALRFAVSTFEDVVLSMCLFLGWFYCMRFMLAYKWTGFFPIMIQRMLLKDIIRFLIVLVFIWVAFFTSLTCAFLATPSVGDYDNVWTSGYSLFKLFVGLQDVESITEARHPGITIFLFVIFVILLNILLFNLLIAMMADTYSRTRDEVTQSWPWMRANTTLLLERRMCPCRPPRYYPDNVARRFPPHLRQFRYRMRNHETVTADPNTGETRRDCVRDDHFVLVHNRHVKAEDKNRDLRSITYRTAGSILW